jgi:hypothetical protein
MGRSEFSRCVFDDTAPSNSEGELAVEEHLV